MKRKPLAAVPKRLAFGGATVPFRLRDERMRKVNTIEEGGNLLASLNEDCRKMLMPQLNLLKGFRS